MRFILIFLIFICFACDHSTPPLAEDEQESPFSIGFGKSTTVKSLDLKIGFQDVLADSRCPTDAMCKWEGRADIRLWLLPSNSDTVFIQSSIFGFIDRDDSTRHLAIDTIGFRIKLLQLDPYPISELLIQKDAYIALLEISRL